MRLFIAISLCERNEKNYALSYQICTQVQPMTCLECTSTVILLADLESISLDYLYYKVFMFLNQTI